jgi:hypothetical protein
MRSIAATYMWQDEDMQADVYAYDRYIYTRICIYMNIYTYTQADTHIHTTMDIHLHAYICSQILEVDLHKTSTDM